MDTAEDDLRMCEKIELKDMRNKKIMMRKRIKRAFVMGAKPKITKPTLFEEIMQGSTIEEKGLFIAIHARRADEVGQILDDIEERTDRGRKLTQMQEKLLRIIVENRFARKEAEFINKERAAQILARERNEDSKLVESMIKSESKNVRLGATVGIINALDKGKIKDLRILETIGATTIERIVLERDQKTNNAIKEKVLMGILYRASRGTKPKPEKPANDTKPDN